MTGFQRANIDMSTITDKVVLQYMKENPDEETWLNDLYQVTVRRGVPTGFGKDCTVAHLSIKRIDKKPVRDWRHLQWIKNELVGEEYEGIELFPKESRLVDGANQYHLWVFEQEELMFPLGFSERLVSEISIFGETQEPFPEDRKPKDLEENHQKLRAMKKQIENGKRD